jgi:hypothetical protein
MQDIEAEDHILGPLSLRQFIFGMIAAFSFYMCFLVVTKHVAFLLIIFLPPGLFSLFFAVPFGHDQPTEVWALAKLRFIFKPRKRIWDQSGVKEMVTITVPKKIERVLTNGLNQYEVESRLNALASTLDSRGWAVKNSTLSIANQSPYSLPMAGQVNSDSDDRLINLSSFPQSVPDDNAINEPDIMDENRSPVLEHFNQMINQSNQEHRQQLVQFMSTPTPPPPAAPSPMPISTPSGDNNQWFMPRVDQTPGPITATDVPAQTMSEEDAELSAQIKAHNSASQVSYGNLRTLQPLGSQPFIPPTDNQQIPVLIPPPQPATPPLTSSSDPAILSLANNDDFSVATLAREAKKAQNEDLGTDEVVISLH